MCPPLPGARRDWQYSRWTGASGMFLPHCCTLHLTTLLQTYAKRPQAFDTDEIMAPFANIEELHQRERVIRALLRRVRVKLQEAGEYESSKLAQLDAYHVKLSEISPLSITLAPMEEGAVPVQGRRPQRKARPSKKARENRHK